MAINNNKICFIICTNDDVYLSECLLYVSQLNIPDGYAIDSISIKDAKSMTEGYNRAMIESDAKYKVYMHQDVLIINRNFIYDMLKVFNSDDKIGMMGLVGNKGISDDVILWGEKVHDRIGEGLQDAINIGAHSIFGKAQKPYEDVLVIDGLLMATQYDIHWREDLFKGWDFYDCSQSLEFIKAGYRVVVPYMESPWFLHDNDILNMENYDKWRQVFKEEYKNIYYKWTDEYLNSLEYEVTELKLNKNISRGDDKFTVLITMHNQEFENKRCIESILKYCDTDKIDLVVVDNHSGESERGWAKSQENISYMYFGDGKVGYAKLINKAVKALNLHSDFIILDSMFYVKDDFIENLTSLIHDEIIGTVSPLFSCDAYNYLFGHAIDEQNIKHSYQGNVLQTMVTQPYAICIKWEAWEKINGFNTNIVSPYYVIMDFQLKVLKNSYQNIIATSSCIRSDSTVSVRNILGEIYNHDMEIMEKTWGMHYFNVVPNHNLVSLIENINADKEENILEIGCDCGATLMAIKNVHPQASLYGIELNESAVSIANSFANVICGNIETDGIAFKDVKFDVIIFGDVLEHLRNPENIIKMCKEHLSENGRIISSIPNVQHISVLRQLIYGRFTYTETGLLDKTHIHLFTKYEILKMFENAGYAVENLRFVQFRISSDEQEMIDKLKKSFPEIDEQGLKAFQYIVSARKN